jgi:hypothetical protein
LCEITVVNSGPKQTGSKPRFYYHLRFPLKGGKRLLQTSGSIDELISHEAVFPMDLSFFSQGGEETMALTLYD